jgi:RHS repeat-associated protein
MTQTSYRVSIRNISDFSPFGVGLEERTVSSNSYRYGFQGQEGDDEIKGEGNSVNYSFRMHDPRVGRFFAVDPLTFEYPHYTPYSFSGNKVISCIELEGLEEFTVNARNPFTYFFNHFEKDGSRPTVLYVDSDSQGDRILIHRPLIESENSMINSIMRKQSTVTGAGTLPQVGTSGEIDYYSFTNMMTIIGARSGVQATSSFWTGNSLTNTVNGTFNNGLNQTFGLVVPQGANSMAVDFVGSTAGLGLNLTLTDNFGNIIYNGPPAPALGTIPLTAGTTSITGVVTGFTANTDSFSIDATVGGGSGANAKTISGISVTTGSTTTTNTEITVFNNPEQSTLDNSINSNHTYDEDK